MASPSKEIVNTALVALLDADEATLDVVQKLINNRRQYLRDQQATALSMELAVGDYARLKGDIRPIYMRGCEVKVLEYLSTEDLLVEVVGTYDSPRREMAQEKILGNNIRVKLHHLTTE